MLFPGDSCACAAVVTPKISDPDRQEIGGQKILYQQTYMLDVVPYLAERPPRNT
jgi:hypothetical protein